MPSIPNVNISAIEHWPEAPHTGEHYTAPGWLNSASNSGLKSNSGVHCVSQTVKSPTAAPGRRVMRVAAVQAAPVAYDLFKSLHKLRSLVFAARENGAEMVVLPEAFLSAYPRHLSFDVGNRTESHREWYGRYVKVDRLHVSLLTPVVRQGPAQR